MRSKDRGRTELIDCRGPHRRRSRGLSGVYWFHHAEISPGISTGALKVTTVFLSHSSARARQKQIVILFMIICIRNYLLA